MEYIVITGNDMSITYFEEEVESKLKEWYILCWGVSITYITSDTSDKIFIIAQALCKSNSWL